MLTETYMNKAIINVLHAGHLITIFRKNMLDRKIFLSREKTQETNPTTHSVSILTLQNFRKWVGYMRE